MTRVLGALLLALTLLSGGLGWQVHRQAGRLAEAVVQTEALAEALRTTQERARKDRALLTRRAQENAVAARESALLRQSLQDALRAEAQWADQPIPEAVRSRLLEGLK